MSNVTDVHPHDTAAKAHADPAHGHPSDLLYLKVGLVLFALTGLEVSTYFVNMKGVALIVVLMPLMVVKFGVVAAYFMHLRFDSRIFRRFFITGIVLAVFVYFIVMFTLHVFD